MSLTKTEARNACKSLSLIERSITGMAEKRCYAFLSKESVIYDGFALLMDGEDDKK